MRANRSTWIAGLSMCIIAGVAPSCLPLGDLDSLSDNYGKGGGGGEGGSTAAVCGNGEVEAGEACDEGSQTASCDADCTLPVCGDGIVNADAAEQCDEGGSTETCFRCDAPEPSCIDGCECLFWGGHHYAFCSASRSVADAADSCRTVGAELASIDSVAEEAFVAGGAYRRSFNEFWLGGTDGETEGTWVWPSGRVFYEDGAAVKGVYQNWVSGEPTGGTGSNCVAGVAGNNAWKAIDCGAAKPFVCEANPLELPSCGNGEIDEGEACDDAKSTKACDVDCTVPRCGDAVFNAAAGEECDDGNTVELDGCTKDCKSTGLLLHYPLSETRGYVGYDDSGFARNLKINGNSGVLDGDPGGVFFWDYYGTVDNSALDFDGDFSILVGIRFTSSADLVYVLSDSGGASSTFDMRIDGDVLETFITDELSERHPSAADPLQITDAAFDSVKFEHFAYTCSGGEWHAYYNGVEVGTVTDSAGTCRLSGGGTKWIVGASRDAPQGALGGRIADLRLYSSVVPAKQILAIAKKVTEL